MTVTLSPEVLLAEATPIVCEAAAYELAIKIGVAGSVDLAERFVADGYTWADALHLEPVVFADDRFKVARHQLDQFDAVPAFVFAGRDAEGEIVDAIAFDPLTDRASTLLGALGTAGLPCLRAPRISPPMVYRTISDWLRAGRDGLVILDDRLAAGEIGGATMAAPDRRSGLALRARLAPHSRRPPQIVVPKNRERRYG